MSNEKLVHILALFYQFDTKPQVSAIKETLKHLVELQNWFNKQSIYHFYSCSVLVIYDAFTEEIRQHFDHKEQSSLFSIDCLVRVKMVDFGRVFPANNTLDLNFLFGLERLIEHHKLLLDTDYKFKNVMHQNENFMIR